MDTSPTPRSGSGARADAQTVSGVRIVPTGTAAAVPGSGPGTDSQTEAPKPRKIQRRADDGDTDTDTEMGAAAEVKEVDARMGSMYEGGGEAAEQLVGALGTLAEKLAETREPAAVWKEYLPLAERAMRWALCGTHNPAQCGAEAGNNASIIAVPLEAAVSACTPDYAELVSATLGALLVGRAGYAIGADFAIARAGEAVIGRMPPPAAPTDDPDPIVDDDDDKKDKTEPKNGASGPTSGQDAAALREFVGLAQPIIIYRRGKSAPRPIAIIRAVPRRAAENVQAVRQTIDALAAASHSSRSTKKRAAPDPPSLSELLPSDSQTFNIYAIDVSATAEFFASFASVISEPDGLACAMCMKADAGHHDDTPFVALLCKECAGTLRAAIGVAHSTLPPGAVYAETETLRAWLDMAKAWCAAVGHDAYATAISDALAAACSTTTLDAQNFKSDDLSSDVGQAAALANLGQTEIFSIELLARAVTAAAPGAAEFAKTHIDSLSMWWTSVARCSTSSALSSGIPSIREARGFINPSASAAASAAGDDSDSAEPGTARPSAKARKPPVGPCAITARPPCVSCVLRSEREMAFLAEGETACDRIDNLQARIVTKFGRFCGMFRSTVRTDTAFMAPNIGAVLVLTSNSKFSQKDITTLTAVVPTIVVADATTIPSATVGTGSGAGSTTAASRASVVITSNSICRGAVWSLAVSTPAHRLPHIERTALDARLALCGARHIPGLSRWFSAHGSDTSTTVADDDDGQTTVIVAINNADRSEAPAATSLQSFSDMLQDRCGISVADTLESATDDPADFYGPTRTRAPAIVRDRARGRTTILAIVPPFASLLERLALTALWRGVSIEESGEAMIVPDALVHPSKTSSWLADRGFDPRAAAELSSAPAAPLHEARKAWVIYHEDIAFSFVSAGSSTGSARPKPTVSGLMLYPYNEAADGAALRANNYGLDPKEFTVTPATDSSHRSVDRVPIAAAPALATSVHLIRGLHIRIVSHLGALGVKGDRGDTFEIKSIFRTIDPRAEFNHGEKMWYLPSWEATRAPELHALLHDRIPTFHFASSETTKYSIPVTGIPIFFPLISAPSSVLRATDPVSNL